MDMNRFKYKYRRLIEKNAVVFSGDQLSTGDVRKIIDFTADGNNNLEDREALLTAVFMQDFIVLDKTVLLKREVSRIGRDLKAMAYVEHTGMNVYVKLPENN